MASKHTPYFNLLDALRAPGCPLCRLAGTAVAQYLDGILYEYVNDLGVRQMVVEAHGLCPTHSGLLLEQHAALGIAILYEAILSHLQSELPETRGDHASWLDRLRKGRGKEAAVLQGHAPCPLCVKRDETAVLALGTLQEHLDDGEVEGALAAGDGFCVPHLQQALETLGEPACRVILAAQRRAWMGLREELREFIRKNDYAFQDEAFGAEGDAWQRAVQATSGMVGVF